VFRNHFTHFATMAALVLVSSLLLVGFSFASTVRTLEVIWSDSSTDQILRAPVDGSAPVSVLFDESSFPDPTDNLNMFGLAADSDYLYWGDLADKIFRGNLDGSGLASVVADASDVRALALDGEHVYWTRWDFAVAVKRAKKDGSEPASVFVGAGEYRARGIDIAGEYLYWTTQNNGAIHRIPTDLSAPETELFDIPGSPSQITVDGDHFYVLDRSSDSIMRGFLDGAGPLSVLYGINDYPGSPTKVNPQDFAIDAGTLYWTDSSTDQILFAPVNGSGPVSVLLDISDYPGSPASVTPRDIVLVETVPEPSAGVLLANASLILLAHRRFFAPVGIHRAFQTVSTSGKENAIT